MRRLVNPVTVLASDLTHGDVMAIVITLHVIKRGDNHVFRMYRCGHPPQEHEGIPQGHRIGHEKEIAQELFPIVGWAGMKPDLF